MIINENEVNTLEYRNPHDRRVVSGYHNYLTNHIRNVHRAWDQFLKPFFRDKLSNQEMNEVETALDNHDKSKWLEDEYQAYADHWYPDESNFGTNDKDYRKATLLHVLRNPHHWNHWVYTDEDETLTPIDMPIINIIEMLCDWSSFQFYRHGTTANEWYKANKGNIVLSDKTRKFVEDILKQVPEL